MSSKKWILTTFTISICLLLILSLITYIFDPLYQYHYSADDNYFLAPRYSSAGLIKNYEYDSVVMGSSMTQNFDLQDFKNQMGLNAIKVTMGGMNLADYKLNMELVNKSGKCKTMFVGIDLHKLAEEEPSTKFPEYLYDGYINDYKYLLSSDVYTHFLPLAIGSKSLKAFGKPIPPMLSSKADINKMGYWNDRYEFGEDVLFEHMLNAGRGLSEINLNNLNERLKNNIDDFFLCISDNTTYYFFFPPYSAFYWEDCEYKNYIDELLTAKKYFYEVSEKYDNINIYDFQNIDQTIDLSYYKDITHYSEDINEFMVTCFAEQQFLVKDMETIESNAIGIRDKIEYVKEKYPNILSSPKYR